MARTRKLSPERKVFINSLIEHYHPEDAQDVQEMLKDNFAQKMSEVLSGVLSQKDIDKVKPILNILEEKGFISPKEAERSCGKSAATVRRYLNLLVQTGIVVLEGNTNNAVYKIIEK